MSEKYDVAVIGSGSGGSEAALLAAEKGLRSILIEKDAIGGTRFHRGCFAVRALHASSRVYLQIAKSRIPRNARPGHALWRRRRKFKGHCKVLIAAKHGRLRSFPGPDLSEAHSLQCLRLSVRSNELVF